MLIKVDFLSYVSLNSNLFLFLSFFPKPVEVSCDFYSLSIATFFPIIASATHVNTVH